MRYRLNKVFVIVCTMYMIAGMIIKPYTCITSAKSAIETCLYTVVPSLFPFIFCSNIVTAFGAAYFARRYLSFIMYPLFGVSGSGAAAFSLGIAGGYPVGAFVSANLYKTGECTKKEAEVLTGFCNNSGPMFIIGIIGANVLGNYKVGVFLYLVHIFSAVLSGVILKHIFLKDNKVFNNIKSLPPCNVKCDKINIFANIGDGITVAIETILKICGFIIIFAVFTSILPNNTLKPYLYASLEITGGILSLSKILDNDKLLLLTSFFLGFSGLSVFMQVAAVTNSARLSLLPYLVGKSIQGIISFLLTLLSLVLNKGYVPVNAAYENKIHIFNNMILYNIKTATIIFAAVLGFLSLIIIFKKIYYFLKIDK